jgi:hypothetical protein
MAALLAALPPYPTPSKSARRTRESVAFTNMDSDARRGAENVQFFVVIRSGGDVAGLVFVLVGHSLS